MSFRYPLDNVEFTQGFGDNPDFYRQYGQIGHNGYDLKCNAGTPVYASNDGIVYFEGYGKNNAWMGSIAGVCCILDHGSVYTGYAHLTSTVINVRDQVTKGQLIGYSGMTGVGTGPHLHFEFIAKPVNINNGYYGRVDPAPFLINNATIDQVRALYLEILERPADDGGLAHYTGNYTVDFIRNDMMNSDEYKQLQIKKNTPVIVPEPVVEPPVIVEEPKPEPIPVQKPTPVIEPIKGPEQPKPIDSVKPKDIVITSPPQSDNETWRYKTWLEKLVSSIMGIIKKGESMKQSRFTSKVFWVGIISSIALALKAFGIVTIDDAVISNIVNTIFTILAIFGVANNPTDAKNL